MTGQVKEEVLTRRAELGLRVVDGRATLVPGLIAPDEVFAAPGEGSDDEAGQRRSASFMVAAVPMTIVPGSDDGVVVVRADDAREAGDELALTLTQSRELFARAGTIDHVVWTIGEDTLQRWARTG